MARGSLLGFLRQPNLPHSMAGGVMSVLQGGKFGHGFAAAGVTAGFSSINNSRHIGNAGFSIGRVALAAVVGGTVSKSTGGKFANGAMTGAFSQAFNQEQQEIKADALKGEVELELNKFLKGKLSAGGIEISADVGAASVSLDQNGKISGTYGILKGEGQFDGLGAKLNTLGVDVDVDVAGAKLALSKLSGGDVNWNIHVGKNMWGYNFGKHIPSCSGSMSVDPAHYLLQTKVGHAGIQYRRGTTQYVENCMSNNFNDC